ncbi:MAG: cyclase family protein [Nostocaceae cyanobacterium]|nr:cyclase family protein [Nostocaceae cyanobacterium]
MDSDRSGLDIVKSYLLQTVAPQANQIDSNPQTLQQALLGLGELDFLALRVPQKWGGKGVREDTFLKFQELVARYSGALAFLQTQHQSAAGMLTQSSNSQLQEEYLPRMGNGEVLVGVGFSQLRRPGEPLITAVAKDGGYQLEGVIPWVTGWGIFQDFIVAASLPDGTAIFGMVPLRETSQDRGGKITFSYPAELAAMTSTNTVSAYLKQWFLPQEHVVFVKPPGWIHTNDENNVLRACFLATGCAFAGLDIIQDAAINKSLAFISQAFDALYNELTQCRHAIQRAQTQADMALVDKLQLRAWSIDLATRIAHAAVTVCSGAANYSHHNAQRVYREALVFTVTGQTSAVMEATLKRLLRVGDWKGLVTGDKEDKQDLGDNYQLPITQSPVTSSQSIVDRTYSQVIHLSHVIDEDIPQWQGDPLVEFETVATLGNDGYYLRRFSMGEHSATHINAPKSFYSNGAGIDTYPADKLVQKAVVIDIRNQATANPDYALIVNDVLAWEEKHGEIPPNCLVLLHTGWQEKWRDKKAFFNQDKARSLHFPGFGGDATQFLLEERQIAGLGIDTHGVDPGQDTTFTSNRLVLAKPRIVLENLTNLDKLPPHGSTLVIGILRLRGGSGSPAAVMALVP